MPTTSFATIRPDTPEAIHKVTRRRSKLSLFSPLFMLLAGTGWGSILNAIIDSKTPSPTAWVYATVTNVIAISWLLFIRSMNQRLKVLAGQLTQSFTYERPETIELASELSRSFPQGGSTREFRQSFSGFVVLTKYDNEPSEQLEQEVRRLIASLQAFPAATRQE